MQGRRRWDWERESKKKNQTNSNMRRNETVTSLYRYRIKEDEQKKPKQEKVSDVNKLKWVISVGKRCFVLPVKSIGMQKCGRQMVYTWAINSIRSKYTEHVYFSIGSCFFSPFSLTIVTSHHTHIFSLSLSIYVFVTLILASILVESIVLISILQIQNISHTNLSHLCRSWI